MSAVALARSRELQPGHVRRADPGSAAAPGEPAASRWRPRLVAAFLLALGVWVVLFVLAGAARAEDPAATAGGDSPLADTAAAEEDPTAVPAASPLPVAEPPASPPDERPVTTTPGTLSESPSTETSPAAPVSAPSPGPTPVQTPIPVPVPPPVPVPVPAPAPVPVLVPAPTPSSSTAQDLSTGISTGTEPAAVPPSPAAVPPLVTAAATTVPGGSEVLATGANGMDTLTEPGVLAAHSLATGSVPPPDEGAVGASAIDAPVVEATIEPTCTDGGAQLISTVTPAASGSRQGPEAAGAPGTPGRHADSDQGTRSAAVPPAEIPVVSAVDAPSSGSPTEAPAPPWPPVPPGNQPVAPAAPAPGATSAGPGCAGTTAFSSGGGSGADASAVIEDSLTATLGRAWTRLSADIAARVLKGADAPAARPD